MLSRMPIPGGVDRNISFYGGANPRVQHRHDLVASLDWQRTAGTEIELNVHDDERVARPEYVARICH